MCKNWKFGVAYPQQQQFSSSSNQQLFLLQKSSKPIKLSTSPINNYKSTKTFNDDISSKAPASKWPLIVGSALLSVLILVMLFSKGEPLDIFSTEVLGQFEEKITSTLQLDKNNSGAGNDIKP